MMPSMMTCAAIERLVSEFVPLLRCNGADSVELKVAVVKEVDIAKLVVVTRVVKDADADANAEVGVGFHAG